MLNQCDHVTLGTATATIEDLLLNVDREAILAAACRTSTDALDLSPELDSALIDHVLDRNALGGVNVIFVHGSTVSRSVFRPSSSLERRSRQRSRRRRRLRRRDRHAAKRESGRRQANTSRRRRRA